MPLTHTPDEQIHEPNERNERHVELQEQNFAFQNRLESFSIVNRNHIDVREFLNDGFPLIQTAVTRVLNEHFLIKVGACFSAIFEKIVITNEGEKRETQTLYLHTKAEIIDFETNLNEFYEEYITQFILQKIEEVELRGSGFKLSEIEELNIQISLLNQKDFDEEMVLNVLFDGSLFIGEPPKERNCFFAQWMKGMHFLFLADR